MKHKLFMGKAATGKTTEMIRLAQLCNNAIVIDDIIGEFPAKSVSIDEAISIARLDRDCTIFLDEAARIHANSKNKFADFVNAVEESTNIKLIASTQLSEYQSKKLFSPILDDLEIIVLKRGWYITA